MVVEQDEVGTLRLRLRETVAAARRRERAMAVRRERSLAIIQKRRIIVDDEDRKRHRAPGVWRRDAVRAMQASADG